MSLIRFLIYPICFFGSSISFLILANSKFGIFYSSVLCFTILAIVVFYLEKFFPYDPEWNRNLGDLSTDIIHNFVNFLLIFFTYESISFLKTKIEYLSFWPDHLPFFVQVLLAGLCIDLGMYWIHRLSHSIPFLWKLHSVHHSSERLYWLNGEKRHPIHAILEGTPGVLVVFILGASPEIVLGWLSILSFHLMFQHGNMDYKSGFLKYIFSVSELHRWHHRKKYRETQVNYGAVFSFWDRIFGSSLGGEGFVKGAEVGLERETIFPKDYLGQLAEPFRF
ncbi:sterol desaturase family protein [Leptospira sarikeiensis]|uniref:Sterol desaturase family protein n=1 Tax=Leptospira sarikeiensis TaxID=2484943 RepID=A0A4R9KAR3_9LEPT|nr:sterol desaturase family protein [Leptospira sarikeiensis]TGL63808.1 sterol desaturase family protein [Leptospira sarikeiensis]